jgi:hypothetical protein
MTYFTASFTLVDGRHDAVGADMMSVTNIATILQKQVKGYTNKDPSIQPQKALPISVFCKMVGEYVKVSSLKHQTKRLHLADIQFFQGNKKL